MKVQFDPDDYQPSGTVSFLSWGSQDLKDAIRQAFHESPRERIAEIVIELEGIKAVFEPRLQ